MKHQSGKKTFGIAIVVFVLLAANAWVLWTRTVRRREAPPPVPIETSSNDITGGVPIQRGRIDSYIAAIRNETLEQSIENLSLHEPLVERAGIVTYEMLPFPRAAERCLANRRLARIFEAFAELPPDEPSRRSQELFDAAVSDFRSACNLILDRWESGNPPTDIHELFGPQRSLDGFLWALRGAELLCAHNCSASVAVENHDQIEKYRSAVSQRVQRKPETLTLPYSEIEQMLQPDLMELNIARVVFERHFNTRLMDEIMPAGMVPEDTRFYGWNAHTNEHDFTYQRRGVPAEGDRILHTFSFYPGWSAEMRIESEPRRALIDECWNKLAELTQNQ